MRRNCEDNPLWGGSGFCGGLWLAVNRRTRVVDWRRRQCHQAMVAGEKCTLTPVSAGFRQFPASTPTHCDGWVNCTLTLSSQN